MEEKLREYEDVWGVERFLRYVGSVLKTHWWVRREILHSMQSETGCQWSVLRMGVIWLNFCTLIRILAALFWMYCTKALECSCYVCVFAVCWTLRATVANIIHTTLNAFLWKLQPVQKQSNPRLRVEMLCQTFSVEMLGHNNAPQLPYSSSLLNVAYYYYFNYFKPETEEL